MTAPRHPAIVSALDQDGTYPRPQLVREHWTDLCGSWQFGFGADRLEGPGAARFPDEIVVPFPPESPASGIADARGHEVLWYRRIIRPGAIAAAGYSEARPRVVLHFAAVDRIADVWVAGTFVGRHTGGQTPFSFDVTDVVDPGGDTEVVVRALDDPRDVSVPRGKQDWREQPHLIWYHRTSGVWQPVWLECVPDLSIRALAWRSDATAARVDVEVDLSSPVPDDAWLHVRLTFGGELVGETRVRCLDRHVQGALVLERQRNGQQCEDLCWTPEHPRLIDAVVTIERGGAVVDAVSSYLGIRTVGVERGVLLMNDQPLFVRAVLAQNYWPESHLAAPSPQALRREVETILALGFNAARVHQKVEDPRFLYWADRLGLLIWAEAGASYAFDDRAVASVSREWIDVVRRDRSHPSIMAWVPFNESWGVQHIAHDPRQRAFCLALTQLTRALDGTRPVISNDGWEHADSDIWTLHDYEGDPQVLAARYDSREQVERIVAGRGPSGRRSSVGAAYAGQPLVLSEFGGVSLKDESTPEGYWGYTETYDHGEYERRVCDLLGAANASPVLSGFCYTQLTDTGQETNGLLYADRSPKFPVDQIRRAVQGVARQAGEYAAP